MNTDELIGKLTESTGYHRANIVTRRPVKLLKTSELNEKKVEKQVTYLRASVGKDYEKGINNQRKNEEKETDFESGKLPWGEWINYPYLIGHKGTNYFRFYVETSGSPATIIKTEYFIDGEPVDGAYLTEHVLASEKKNLSEDLKKMSKKQNVENPVVPITLKIENVVSVKCGDVL